MAPAKRKIVVIGATGRQGGATVQHLQKNAESWDIVALSRDPTSDEAKALSKSGVTVVKGDCLDVNSLVAAFQGAYGVFGVTNPFAKKWNGTGQAHTDTDAEVVQGKNIADACKTAGVQHLVFASVASADQNTGVPTFDAKWQVEQYIKQLGIPATVIAPSGFFENMESPFAGLKQGSMPGLLKKGRKAQMISTYDIGWFVVNCFDKPSEWIGKRLEIAGDEHTAEEQCEVIARLRGEEGHWKVSTPPDWVFKLFIPKAVGTLKRFLDEQGSKVDIGACRAIHPGLMTFEAWCKYKGIDKKQLPSPGWCTVQ